MRAYAIFSTRRYIFMTATVKVRIGSVKCKNGSERTRLYAPKVTQEVNFPKYLWGYWTREWL